MELDFSTEQQDLKIIQITVFHVTATPTSARDHKSTVPGEIGEEEPVPPPTERVTEIVSPRPVDISQADPDEQVPSTRWGGKHTHISYINKT